MEPLAPALPVEAAPKPVEPANSAAKIFHADRTQGPDALGIEPIVALCAELAIHQQAEPPLCIGFLGGPGTGKSFALSKLKALAESLAGRAKAKAALPYVPDIAVATIDAAQLDGEPTTALASALCTNLHATIPDLVDEALRSVQDPHAAIAETSEKLDQVQRRFHQERDHLTEVEGRRARLFDTLLYQTPGSQVDAYIRTQKPRIFSALEAFGFTGDQVLNYKDLVGALASVHSPLGRSGIYLRSLWSFKGQARLLAIALVLVLLGYGLNWAVVHKDLWLAPLRASRESMTGLVNWLEAQMGIIAGVGKLAYLGALAVFALNIFRAVRFLQPISRGAALLDAEIASRKHELDSSVAHQTKRVDGLLADVERAARAHAEADQIAGRGVARPAHAASLFQPVTERGRAAQFIASLGALIEEGARGGRGDGKGPKRVLLLLDNLDALPYERASEILDAAHHVFSNGVFVTVLAVNPDAILASGHGGRLEKWIQVPVQLDALEGDRIGFVSHLLGRSLLPQPAAASEPPQLDGAISAEEEGFLLQLAPLAGSSARALKRFINLYRLARPLLPDHKPLLAFMLALKNGGTRSEVEAMRNTLAVAKPGSELDVSQEHRRLADALMVVSHAQSSRTAEAAHQAFAIAEVFSFER